MKLRDDEEGFIRQDEGTKEIITNGGGASRPAQDKTGLATRLPMGIKTNRGPK